MLENSANKTIPARVKRFRHYCSSACRKWWRGAMVAVLSLLVISVFVWRVIEYRDILMVANAKPDAAMNKTNAEAEAQFHREIAILIAGVVGMILTMWRLKLAGKRILIEQFSNAAELMAKETTGKEPRPAFAARISGIHIMEDLATRYPREFAEQVVKNLIAYIIENAQETKRSVLGKDAKSQKIRVLGGDVKAAFSALSNILGNEKINIDERILDFSQADFSGLDFAGIDLKKDLQHYKKWVETKFRGCYLAEAHFADGADMQRADFSGATLQQAILKGADLYQANFQGANLVLADMQGCYMPHARLQTIENKKTNLAEANLAGAYLYDAKLNGADMNGTILHGAMLFCAYLPDVEYLPQAKFGETYMVGATINGDDGRDLCDLAKDRDRKIWLKDDDTKWKSDRSHKTNWRLEEYKDGYALAGVLRNFADAPYKGIAYSHASAFYPSLADEPENIKRQAAKLEKLPDNTPEEVKAWWEKIKAEYSK